MFALGFKKTAGPIGRSINARMAHMPDTFVSAERHYAASRLNDIRKARATKPAPALRLVSSQKSVKPSAMPATVLAKAAMARS
jgi:hypothetical protein